MEIFTMQKQLENKTTYMIAAIGLAASIVAFYAGKSQSRLIVVPGQQTIYIRTQQELDKEEKAAKQQALLNSRRSAKERSALMADAGIIGMSIVQYAVAHRSRQGLLCQLPTQQEIERGCLNPYQPGGQTAWSYVQQERLQITAGNSPQFVYDSTPQTQRVAYVFGAGGKVVIYGDGHTWWEAG